MLTHAWSTKRNNIDISYNQYYQSGVACLAGVSESHGLDHLMLFDQSVNIQKFKVFLEELRQKYLFDDICLYMDNLAVHISNTIKERMDELGIAYVYSVIYSPQFNPIEEVFAMSKKIIKDRRLKAIMNNEEILN